jgi:glycosyltransferase involved in cell wall biosynthesis
MVVSEKSVKLMIQIPCLNERDHLPGTFADLPRQIEGIDEIEVLIVDDGSSDGTHEVAERIGVHHVVRFPDRRGLAAAYAAGVDACLRLGADVIVNTDADNQYYGEDIALLVAPIVAGQADIVVGDRQTDRIEHFSPIKRVLQRWGSRVVRGASGTEVRDSTSGFRAINRKAASKLFVHNRFTYTLETIIQAGRTGLVTRDVRIRTNPKTRESRLFRSIPDYLRRSVPVIMRSYAMYRPVRTFSFLALSLLLIGLGLVGRFLFSYVQNPDASRHVQSVVAGVGAVILAFLVGLVAMLSDLLAANRRLLEEVMSRVRGIEASLGAPRVPGERRLLDGILSTGAAPWTRGPSQGKATVREEPRVAALD